MQTDTIQITLELLALIAEIDECKGAWRAWGILAPERLRALRRVATIESIGSSTRMEGSKLTDREVEHLLAALEIQKFSTRDEQEVSDYAEVMKTIFRAWADIPITENHLKQLHRDLLLEWLHLWCVKAKGMIFCDKFLREKMSKKSFEKCGETLIICSQERHEFQ